MSIFSKIAVLTGASHATGTELNLFPNNQKVTGNRSNLSMTSFVQVHMQKIIGNNPQTNEEECGSSCVAELKAAVQFINQKFGGNQFADWVLAISEKNTLNNEFQDGAGVAWHKDENYGKEYLEHTIRGIPQRFLNIVRAASDDFKMRQLLNTLDVTSSACGQARDSKLWEAQQVVSEKYVYAQVVKKLNDVCDGWSNMDDMFNILMRFGLKPYLQQHGIAASETMFLAWLGGQPNDIEMQPIYESMKKCSESMSQSFQNKTEQDVLDMVKKQVEKASDYQMVVIEESDGREKIYAKNVLEAVASDNQPVDEWEEFKKTHGGRKETRMMLRIGIQKLAAKNIINANDDKVLEWLDANQKPL